MARPPVRPTVAGRNEPSTVSVSTDMVLSQVRSDKLPTASVEAVFSSSMDAVLAKDLAGTVTLWNPAAERMFGWLATEIVGRNVTIIYPADRVAEERGILARVGRGEQIRHYETQRQHKDGHRIDVSVTISPIRDPTGTVIGASAIVRDISDRRKAEEALKKASDYARSLIEASLDPILTIAPDGRIADVNHATEIVTGYGRKRIIGAEFASFFTEPEKAQEGYQRCFMEGSVTDFPLSVKAAAGRVIEVMFNASVFRDESGAVQGVVATARDVTERKRGEDALRKASDYARSLIEASLDPLVTISTDGKITDVNRATEDATGVPREKLIGSDFSDYFTEPEKAREGYKKAFSEGSVTNYPLVLRHLSGRLIDVLYNATVYEDEFGNVQGVFAAARDVTSTKRAEDDAKKASVYARSLIEASLDPLVTIDPEGKITDVNRATERVTGLGRKRLIGSDFSDYFTEPDRAREGYQRVFREGSVTDFPLAIRHATGRVIDVLYNASVYRDEQGNVQGVFAAAREIAERKKAEDALRRASDYARSLIEASRDPLVTISPRGKITDVNRATEEVTGVPRDKLIGSDFSDYFTDPDKAREGYKKAFSEGSVTDYPLAIRHATGRVTDVLYNASVFEDEYGNVQGVFAAARDVTSRKKAEDEIKRASTYSRSLIEASVDPLVTISADGKITDVNRATEEVTGAPREKLVGSDFSDYFTEPEKARAGYRAAFEAGSVRDYPLAIRHASGRVTDVLYNANVYRDEQGNVQGVFAAARDITARKAAETLMARKSTDLERSNTDLERFAYTASHDLKEPLRMVSSYVGLIKRKYEGKLDAKADEYIRFAEEGATRMEQLIDGLLEFSRVGSDDRPVEPTELGPVAAEVVGNLKARIEESGGKVEVGRLPRVLANASQMTHVLQNLVANALKFHGKEAPVVRIHAQKDPSGWRIGVTDNGIGIDPQYQSQLFELFRRLHTRDEFAGNGIGLAVCKRIIQRHGGRIWVESEGAGRGSTFWFTLPAPEASP